MKETNYNETKKKLIKPQLLWKMSSGSFVCNPIRVITKDISLPN